MPKYEGWEPSEATGDGARKWKSIVAFANRRKVKPRLSFVKGMWNNYAQRKEESGGIMRGRGGMQVKPVSAKEYLERKKAEKKGEKK